MIVLPKGLPTYFDVDDTLLFWGADKIEADDELVWVTVPSRQNRFPAKVHKKHRAQVIEHSQRGHLIIVWSAGGVEWAEAAVRALGLEKYVDLVMEKPRWFYDDQKSDHFLPESNRRYFEE